MAAQILIVEDEKDLLEVLEHRLNKEGYETLGFLSTKNVRQAIAESWPNNMDDSCAREEWGWKPQYSLETMTTDMIRNISQLKQYVS